MLLMPLASSVVGSQAAYARRGAHWTFDGEAFVRCVRSIREGDAKVEVPAYHHGTGDPSEGEILVDPEIHR
jgi:pantothenate kinase